MDKLDQFFKDKFQGREFEFQDAYWQEAEKLIQQDKRKKRLLWWRWTFGLLMLALLIISGGIWFTSNNNAPQPKQRTPTEILNTAEKIKPFETLNAFESDSTGFLHDNAVIPKKEQLSKAQKEAKETARTQSKSYEQAQNKTNTPKSNHDALPDWLQTPKVVKDGENGDGPEPIREIVADNILADQLLRPSEEVLMTNFSFLPLRWHPIEANMSEAPDAGNPLWLEELELKRASRMEFGVQFKAMFYPNTRGDNKDFIGMVGGVDLAYKLGKKLKLETALRIRQRTGTFSKVDETEVLFFSFGRSETKFELLPSELYFLEVPLGLSRSFGFHQIETGLTTAYLLGAKGALQNTLNPELSQNLIKEDKGWVDENSFKKWHWDLYIGYQWRYNNKISLLLDFNFTPGSILDKSFNPTQEVVLKESGLVFIDLGIRYKLF